jgi:trehalose 6-phosphate phosphatase
MSSWVYRVMKEKTPDRPLVLLFDYDGTLAPLAAHPRLAIMPASTREALAALAAPEDVTVAVISGRALGFVKSLVELPGLWYAGSNGMHIDLGEEERIDPCSEAFEPLVDALMTALAGPVNWFPGTWIERKPGCLSLHYRSLLPLMAACFVEEVQDVLTALQPTCPPLRVRQVSKSVEVALADSWTKGDAISWMLMRRPANAFPVFFCDGGNDEEGVAIVNARGGLTVGVGSDAPADAMVRVAAPRDLAEDLANLARMLASPSPRTVQVLSTL